MYRSVSDTIFHKWIYLSTLLLVLTGCKLTPQTPDLHVKPEATRFTSGSQKDIETSWGTNGIWSPNNRFYTIPSPDKFDGMVQVIIDRETGKASSLRTSLQPRVFGSVRWTDDSRYVIYDYSSQYGNGRTVIFDTTAWSTVFKRGGGCGHSMISMCPGAVVDLKTDPPQVKYRDTIWLLDGEMTVLTTTH